MRKRARSLLLFACLVTQAMSTASASPGQAGALYVFEEARRLCERDDGALWGRSLCGPIMIVDPVDRGMVANQQDRGGVLQASDGAFVGQLPPEVMLANTRVEWSGTEWTQLVWPVPLEPGVLRVFLVHEMFHRIQRDLGLARNEAGNRHLDMREGRYLLQLEWRALAQALMADDEGARRDRIADALAFRHERRRLFHEAAADESALEVNEGIPEYTGVRLGLAHDGQRRAYAVYALARFLDAPSFVRSFAYASGPAYGLLLDQADPGWHRRLDADADLGALLARAHGIGPPDPAGHAARVQRYDRDGSLGRAEDAREQARAARVAAWRATLVDGPRLVLPLARTSYQFNPQTLATLDGIGTVYPSLRLTDAWGELVVVEGGAALVHADRKRAAVALPANRAPLAGEVVAGEGWTLTLAPGWTLVVGEREGDMTLAPGPH